MITLTLLHPIQSVPVQSWTFDGETTVRIGRSQQGNEVVLYSAVVSRHHVEVQFHQDHWELKNIGSNGTYINGKRIESAKVVDGMIIRLASSGPKIQIRIGGDEESGGAATGRARSSQLRRTDSSKDTLIS